MNYPTLSLTLGEWGGHKQQHTLFECIGMMHFNWIELSFFFKCDWGSVSI